MSKNPNHPAGLNRSVKKHILAASPIENNTGKPGMIAIELVTL